MVRFYDPVNDQDLDRVVQLLRSGGIEYTLVIEPESDLGGQQILVAEEDIPEAERLLSQPLH